MTEKIFAGLAVTLAVWSVLYAALGVPFAVVFVVGFLANFGVTTAIDILDNGAKR